MAIESLKVSSPYCLLLSVSCLIFPEVACLAPNPIPNGCQASWQCTARLDCWLELAGTLYPLGITVPTAGIAVAAGSLLGPECMISPASQPI